MKNQSNTTCQHTYVLSTSPRHLTKYFDWRYRLTKGEGEAPGNIVKVMQNLNTGNYTSINAVDNYTNTRKHRNNKSHQTGRQSQPIYIQPNNGRKYYQNCIICYADDAVLIGETEDDLQRQLHKLRLLAAQLNMNISEGKSKYLTLNREPIRCKHVV